MNAPATTEWYLPLSRSDFDKLVKGFSSPWMEDKWRVTTTPKDNDTYTIDFVRSWTGISFYVLEVVADHPVSKSPAITSMTWESHTTSDWYLTDLDAKDSVIHLSRKCMKCELEGYPEVDWNTLWDIAPLFSIVQSDESKDPDLDIKP
jgi:hypothetical protein